MLQIQDVVVSFDVLKEKFLCDLSACHGACCIEGDAGAPLELDEIEKIEEVLPLIWEELSPEAQTIIDKQMVRTVCSPATMTGVAVIVPSRRLAVRERPTSSNPFPAISIPYG